MCFAAAPLVAMGVSAAMSAAGAASSANAQNKQAEYNAQVAQNNALMARQEGLYARTQAERNAGGQHKQTERLIGAQRARQGASGVVVDSGSTADVVQDTADTGAREAAALLQQGDTEAWRAENKARSFDAEYAQAKSSKVSVGSAVAGSLLSSAASATMQYAAMGGFKESTPSGGEAPANQVEKLVEDSKTSYGYDWR